MEIMETKENIALSDPRCGCDDRRCSGLLYLQSIVLCMHVFYNYMWGFILHHAFTHSLLSRHVYLR